MKALREKRRAIKYLAGRATGIEPSERFWTSQLTNVLASADLAELPVDLTNHFPIQDASGNLRFIVGISDPFGNDPL